MKNNTNKKYTSLSLLFVFLRGSKKYFIFGILAAFIMTVTEMLGIQIIAKAVDCITGQEVVLPGFLNELFQNIGAQEYVRTHIPVVALCALVVGALSAVMKYFNTYFNTKGAETLIFSIRNKLFSHIEKLPSSWYDKNKTGDIIQRCTSDVETVKNFVSEQLISVFRIVILIALALSVMFSMNAKLALVATVCIPIIVISSLLFRIKISKLFTKCDECEGELSSITQENLTGVRVVRAFGREAYEKDKFADKNNLYKNSLLKMCRVFSWFWCTGDIISGIQVMLVVVLGTVYCVSGEMTVGSFIAFISYNTMLIWPVRSLGRVISEMSKAGVSVERLKYIINSPIETQDGTQKPDMHGDIIFDNVSFKYPESDASVLSKINMKIKGGSVVGIMGATGSGKSTLMQLLDRLYEIDENCGKISINGVSVKDIDRNYLHENIGYVLQESFLFSKTLAENIGITLDNIDMERIQGVSESACLKQAVNEFHNGYDTVVGERGVTLSGGQKQRCAIARMLIRKTPIMIFDDSMSAVDTQTDLEIRKNLRENFGDSTVILISHRITTLMNADYIYVLDDGKIIESGTHNELISSQGSYAKIFKTQNETEVNGDEK